MKNYLLYFKKTKEKTPLMDYKYAIFDLDGTIFDSMFYWRNNIALHFLKSKGYTIPKELEKKTFGLYADKTMELVCAELGISEKLEFPQDYREKVLRPAYENDISAKPYAIEFLRLLKAKGVRICAATATARDLMMPALIRLGMDDIFEFLITTDEVGKSKNHSDIYDIALEKIGGNKENTAVFEDALYCVRTVSDSGYRLFAKDDPYSQKDREEIESRCEKYIEDYGQYINEIKNS